uniref:DNA polymerase iota isoform X1 n=1 Tax=Pogona vitticeps TaxID=103695 RepID=A0A6J0V4L9_9SAUR
MESPGEEEEDNEEEEEEAAAEPDWLLPAPGGAPRRSRLRACYGKRSNAGGAQHRVIVHLDLDCFYAQVEMVCNPELRGKPLGVQQKSIVVTSNYEARNVGVKKLMSVKEAKEKCPELVLVNGEDLTKYREMSYKITALLEGFTPLVERLGFDENFVDITEMVELRLEQGKKEDFSKISVSGHVYNNQMVRMYDPIHVRLAVGSQIAAEMREAMFHRLGLTGCAGVALNKLLSKLVSGTFKPNQQTVLLPESRQDLMASLDHIRKVPGIGFKTAKCLEMLGLRTVCDLQMCSSVRLERELGVLAAQHIQKLSWGEDNSPVTPSGAPQSLSDEDSFKKCSSEAEVEKKVEGLLASLLERLHKDGRKPHTIRLTIRQFTPSLTDKGFSRESRQCLIPSYVIQKIGTGDASVKTHLVAILMKLFRKMINVNAPFHLTLLNVCFSNLKAPPASAKQSIGFYLTRPSSSSSISGKLVNKTESWNAEEHPTLESQTCDGEASSGVRSTGIIKSPLERPGLLKDTDFLGDPVLAGVDYDVFSQLPKDIQEEIISDHKEVKDHRRPLGTQTFSIGREEMLDEAQNRRSHTPQAGSTHRNVNTSVSCGIAPTNEEPSLAICDCAVKHPSPQHSALEAAGITKDYNGSDGGSPSFPSRPSLPRTCIPEEQKHPNGEVSHYGIWKDGPKLALPPSIDPKTFSELPSEVQKELLAEWKGQALVPKMHASKTHAKPKMKKKSEPPLPPPSNSLLRYFKPR